MPTHLPSFLNGPTPASFSFIFGIYFSKKYNLNNKSTLKNVHPVGILCQDSNPGALKHESSPITT